MESGVRGPSSSIDTNHQYRLQNYMYYAHLRSGFRKSNLPISRLARPSASTITTTASSSNPYPPHSNPTPHQIFHLPLTGASQKEVKSRCLHRFTPIDTPFDVKNSFVAPSDTLQIMNL
jgi:hypothetical protein